MLFRCLHPIGLDTGPWPKKSSMLCFLLLLLASFSVLQVSGQAEPVGLGKHTLNDGKVMLNTNSDYNYISVKSIPTEYKKFPGSCNVQIKDGFIELQYNGTLCTVDLLSDLKDMIKLKAGVRHSRGIGKCLDNSNEDNISYSNLLPFIYSKNNYVIKDFSTRGPFNKECENKFRTRCGLINGTCLKWTSLEVSWSQAVIDAVTYAHARIQLIREKKSGLYQLNMFKLGGNETTFDLEINSKGMFKMNFSEESDYYKHRKCCLCSRKRYNRPTKSMDNHKYASKG